MTNTRNRTNETIAYSIIWVIVIGLYLLGSMRSRAQLSESLLDLSMLKGMIHTMLPLFVLFIVNNNLLIPGLLLKNKWKTYVAVTACLLAALLCYQYFDFMAMMRSMPSSHKPMPHPDFQPLMPMPVLLDFTYGLLVIGGNLAITLMFQRYNDRLERESLLKTNAENRLEYLKAQINPHFYLNMLNNIHGMIDIDPDKAQSMLIDMSKLMRFMLYDSSKPEVALCDEISFLENYMALMRQRYPADRVTMTWQFPEKRETAGIRIPPLLFISFIENAFKHGVTYREQSFISVKMEISEGKLHFAIINSVPCTERSNMPDVSSGIGLNNVKQRLRLLYGDNAELDIKDEKKKYVVSLTIPTHDTENPDN